MTQIKEVIVVKKETSLNVSESVLKSKEEEI